jgi:hypothetical protein
MHSSTRDARDMRAQVLDDQGVRLAKRNDALSLRSLRAQGRTPEELRAGWVRPAGHPEAAGAGQGKDPEGLGAGAEGGGLGGECGASEMEQ